MTRRWVPGKKPSKEDVKGAITNSISSFIHPADVEKIAAAIMRLIDDRASGRS